MTKYSLLAALLVFQVLWYVAPFPGWQPRPATWLTYNGMAADLNAMPRPGQNMLLDSILLHSPSAYYALLVSWAGVLFLLPFLVVRFPLASAVERMRGGKKEPRAGKLPPYPDVAQRRELYLVVGETHVERRMVPCANPKWLVVPDAGLYIGTLVMGSSGSGKTTSLLLPAAHQLFGYMAQYPALRCGGLVLEAKGNFCSQVRDVLFALGRHDDYVEIGPASNRCYNPLFNDTDPTELAFDIMAMIRNLGGDTKAEGKFWDDAAESLISFLIQTYRLLEGYVTLREVYIASMDRQIIDGLMETAEARLNPTLVLIEKDVWLKLPDEIVNRLRTDETGRTIKWESTLPCHFKTKSTPDLVAFLRKNRVPHSYEEETGGPGSERRARELASVRLSYRAMRQHDSKTFDNVCYGLQVVLDVCDKNDDVRRIFCPPREAYDPELNPGPEYKHGHPLAKLEEMIETPAVIALRVPISANAKVARIMGTLLKQNWQRAAITRINRVTEDSRSLVLLADEYHLLATAGGSRPIGDDKFLSLSREARVIPVVAIPSISALRESLPRETWATLFSSFATVICLRQNDQFSADHVSKMAGRELQWRQQYSMGEGNADPRVSPINGAVVSEKRSVSLGHSWNIHMDHIYEPKVIRELPRGVAIAMCNSGTTQMPPTYVYLHRLSDDPSIGFFA